MKPETLEKAWNDFRYSLCDLRNAIDNELRKTSLYKMIMRLLEKFKDKK